MSNKKITQLPVATTPVASTDVLPVVQSGATKQAAINQLGFLPAGTGAVTTTVQAKLRESVSVKDFGAVGNGVTDDTAAIQAAMTYAFTQGKTLFLPAGTYGVSHSSSGSGYALLNRGVAIIGEGTFYSMIKALPTMEAGTDFIRVEPNSGAFIDFLNFSRFSIQPTNGATKYGRHCIYLKFETVSNCSFFHMSDLYLFAGNDYSFKIYNNTAINAQGIPANSVIERCFFNEGTEMLGVGDSVSIQNNAFRSTVAGNVGIRAIQTTASGTASMFVVRENNFDCVGGAFIMLTGRNTKFLNNNVELSAGTGTVNGAVVDIDGSSGLIPFAEVSGNHIGIFGTATATSAIRVNGSLGCAINNNTLLAGIAVATAVSITASANSTQIGLNEVNTTFTTAYTNSGGGTYGVYIPITPINSFTNTAGYVNFQCIMYASGLVTLFGVLDAPASPTSGTIIGVLPVKFRPQNLIRFVAGAVVGGAISTCAIEVGTTGNVTFFGSITTTRLEIQTTFQASTNLIPLNF
jgi:hypothetical protein